ncbi:hypothetical protein AVEN_230639-1 [Araneus ventricosus]|uniref:Uncharacterized protein n=1 Tax=Araneus ventricosus TaxID=182803 RepID=A0A4Y2A2P1_ARAVE|nr:hypothetical protein AVEN_230639-1 [Araneus ventricosus]
MMRTTTESALHSPTSISHLKLHSSTVFNVTSRRQLNLPSCLSVMYNRRRRSYLTYHLRKQIFVSDGEHGGSSKEFYLIHLPRNRDEYKTTVVANLPCFGR